MIDDMGIFKYYSPQDYNFMAFCKNQIFFSRPSNLNDPFDTTKLIVNSYKKFCEDIHWNDIREKNLDEHGICSFSEGEKADNRHLWSLYAANYAGYALEFNFDILQEQLPRIYKTPIYLQKVRYEKKPFNLNNYRNTFAIKEETFTIQDAVSGDIKKVGDRLFHYLHLYKDKSIWQNEKEWRMIIGNLNKSTYIHKISNGYLLDLLPNTIKSIIMGCYMTEDNKHMLKNCAKHKGIPMYEAIPCIERNKWKVKIKEL